MTTSGIDYGSVSQMTVANLNSLANSASAGWQSDRVDNTSVKAVDYQVNLKIDLENTAAANDKAIYVYVVPWFWDGSAFVAGADGGTTTPPSGAEGNYTISTTHGFKMAKVIPYTASGQVVYGYFSIANLFGSMPDGWSLVIINYTGAAIAASGNAVQFKPIKYASA